MNRGAVVGVLVLAPLFGAMAVMALWDGADQASEEPAAKEESGATQEAQEPEPEPEAPAALPARPPLEEILGHPPAHVREVLGAPADTDDEFAEDEFRDGPLKLTVDYKRGAANNLLVCVDGAEPRKLVDWVSPTDVLRGNGRRYRLDLGSTGRDAYDAECVWLHEAELPEKPLPIRRALGRRKESVGRFFARHARRVLGPARDGSLPDRPIYDDWGFLFTIDYDREGVLRYLSISPPPGLHADTEEFRRWLGLPPDDELKVRGKRYVIRADRVGLTLERRYGLSPEEVDRQMRTPSARRQWASTLERLSGGTEIEARGRGARVLRVYAFDCSASGLRRVLSTIGDDLGDRGFRRAECHDGSRVVASEDL